MSYIIMPPSLLNFYKFFLLFSSYIKQRMSSLATGCPLVTIFIVASITGITFTVLALLFITIYVRRSRLSSKVGVNSVVNTLAAKSTSYLMKSVPAAHQSIYDDDIEKQPIKKEWSLTIPERIPSYTARISMFSLSTISNTIPENEKCSRKTLFGGTPIAKIIYGQAYTTDNVMTWTNASSLTLADSMSGSEERGIIDNDSIIFNEYFPIAKCAPAYCPTRHSFDKVSVDFFDRACRLK